MEEIVKHINDTNASYRHTKAGNAKNTDLFLDNEHYEFFKDYGEQITVRYNKENLTKAILFIASILPRKFDQSSIHKIIGFSKEFVLDQLAILDAFFKENNVSTNTVTQVWYARKDSEQKNGKIDKRFYFNGLIKDVEYIDSKGVHKKTKFTIRNYFAGGYSNLHIKKTEEGIFDIVIENTQKYIDDKKEEGLEEIYHAALPSLPLQQIYFGAPGTGKSAEIKKLTTGKNPIRTTFHPDSDYSTFVGAYKPTMEFLPICDEAGEHLLKDGKPMFKEQITYKFVPQAFLMAYVEAWKKYAAAPAVETPKEQYLIIEEINRGNCAQIFGDLFQLLDRNDYGFSDYPIKADADMKKYLETAFNGISLDNFKDEIQMLYDDENIVKKILSGDILVLPSNLFIWATMNTSDQSLFPIDSAFKRRWDWQYVPISDAGLGYTISVNGCEYDWAEFIEAINDRIQGATDSEDKKMGYFFCKSPSGIIDAKMFVSKVLFYLWTDVFKDADTNDGINPFYLEGSLYSFDKFFSANENGTDINETLVGMFLDNLVENRSNEESEKTIVNSVITVNGKEMKKVNAIPYTSVEDFVKNNPTLPAIDVFNTWDPFKKTTTRRWFIADKALFDTLDTRNQNYSYKIECGDGNFVWINKDGWVHNPKKSNLRDTIKDFIKEINDNPQLGITITETPKPKPANVEAPKTEE